MYSLGGSLLMFLKQGDDTDENPRCAEYDTYDKGNDAHLGRESEHGIGRFPRKPKGLDWGQLIEHKCVGLSDFNVEC